MNKLLLAESLLSLMCSCGEVRPSAAPPPPPAPTPVPAFNDRFDALIVAYSRKRGLDPRLVKAIIAVESQFCPWAVSRAGARGLMQVMPATAVEFGVSPARLREAEANIVAGTAYLRRLVRAARAIYRVRPGAPLPHWLERRVIAAYHGGPRNLFRTEWAPSTRDYVRDVLRRARSQRVALPALKPDFRNS